MLIRQDAKVLADFFQQAAVLLGQTLLFQVDQLAEGHAQDRIGLDRGQRVRIRFAAFFLEQLEARVAQRPLHHGSRAGNPHQADLGVGLRRRVADDSDNLVDVG